MPSHFHKLHRPVGRIFIMVFGVLLLLAQTSCWQKPKPPLRDEVRLFHQARLHYYLNSYDQHGVKNPAWDKPMRTFIEETTHHIYADTAPLPESLTEAFDALDQAKCSDPYFLSLSARYLRLRITQPYPWASYAKAHLAMRGSNYDPLFKFDTAVGAAREAYHPTDPVKRRVYLKLQSEAFEYLIQTVSDPGIADEYFAAAAEAYFQWIEDADEPLQEIRARATRLEAAVQRHRPDRALMLRLLGSIQITLAWGARGGDWASTVTPEGWAAFSHHLDAAELMLERSWTMLPNSRTAGHMITVELGQHRGRERMELWFQRAMEINPGNSNACYAKLQYLRPRWHGSHEEMLGFANECAENPAWSGRVPLVLSHAMTNYIDDYPKADQAELWKNPKVWALVEKSYEAYLKKNPDDEAARHDYLVAAHRSAAWDVFGRQFKKIKSVKQIYLDRAKLDRMLTDYAAHLAQAAQP
jgi:Domain of unknown function (DUF4034)